MLHRVVELGAIPVESPPACLVSSPADGVLPDQFYATGNLPTEVLVDGEWLGVASQVV